jgi:hypothetical protein
MSVIDHPDHYGGADNPYEAIKVIEAWGLGFNLGNVVKYVSRAGKKGTQIEDLRKARWYLDREISNQEKAMSVGGGGGGGAAFGRVIV